MDNDSREHLITKLHEADVIMGDIIETLMNKFIQDQRELGYSAKRAELIADGQELLKRKR